MNAQIVEPDAYNWQQDASCRQMDPDLFFPDRGTSAKGPKSICSACPVREICLQTALVNDERHGIWGGLSRIEREKIRRRMGLPSGKEAKREERDAAILRLWDTRAGNHSYIAKLMGCSSHVVRRAIEARDALAA